MNRVIHQHHIEILNYISIIPLSGHPGILLVWAKASWKMEVVPVEGAFKSRREEKKRKEKYLGGNRSA